LLHLFPSSKGGGGGEDEKVEVVKGGGKGKKELNNRGVRERESRGKNGASDGVKGEKGEEKPNLKQLSFFLYPRLKQVSQKREGGKKEKKTNRMYCSALLGAKKKRSVKGRCHGGGERSS